MLGSPEVLHSMVETGSSASRLTGQPLRTVLVELSFSTVFSEQGRFSFTSSSPIMNPYWWALTMAFLACLLPRERTCGFASYKTGKCGLLHHHRLWKAVACHRPQHSWWYSPSALGMIVFASRDLLYFSHLCGRKEPQVARPSRLPSRGADRGESETSGGGACRNLPDRRRLPSTKNQKDSAGR